MKTSLLPRGSSPMELLPEPPAIVVELVSVAEIALHALSVRRRKPPLYS